LQSDNKNGFFATIWRDIWRINWRIFWQIAVFLPMLISGTPPAYAWLFAAIFVSYVIGDCIAIPFRHLLARESKA